MIPIKEKYVTDEDGKRTAVVIDVQDYEKLREYMEDMEDALELMKAKNSSEEFIPLDEWEKQLTTEERI